MRTFLFAAGVFAVALLGGCAKKNSAPGGDVARVLRAAETGAPLRVVLLGGSITQGGHGWIGGWLRRTFPRSATFVQNAGLGGTGSDLGNFRLDRDVLAYDPHLVFIESCVNDAARPDEDVIRDLESLVTRLRGRPRPPAIVLLIAAQERGLDKSRHQKVADHYGLLTIDLDAALHAQIAAGNLRWTDCMVDAVHPNDRGNQFYSGVIERELEAVRNGGPRADPPEPAAALSEKPLWADANLVALRGAPGWWAEDVPAGWRYRIFPGLIGADEPGATLEFPFRGTAVGLLYPAAPGQGCFYATIDDRAPVMIRENTHAGYGFRLLADDLPPGEHVLRIDVAEAEPKNQAFPTGGPVKLGYVAVANQNAASPGGPAKNARSAERREGGPRFEPVPHAGLVWTGPFGNGDGKKRYRARMDRAFAPELAKTPGENEPAPMPWKPIEASDGQAIDLRALGNGEGAGVFYVRGRIDAEESTSALLRSTITGAKKIWVNDRPVPVVSREIESDQPIISPISLRSGTNEILWKIGSVNDEARFSASISVPEGRPVKFAPPR